MKSEFKINEWLIIPNELAITSQQGLKITIQPKFMDVLCYLAEQFPRVIPRDELIEKVWLGNDLVGEKALTNAIWQLRKSLHTENDDSEVIETIRKVGYRLVIEPKLLAKPIPVNKLTSADSHLGSDNRTIFAKLKQSYIAPMTLILLLIVFWSFWHEDSNHSTQLIEQITKEPGSELFPAPSPNGRYIVYKWSDFNNVSNLYMKDRQQPELAPKQLTFDQAKQGLSVWSNDGQYIYFSRKDRAKNICDVVRLHVQSNQEKIITECPIVGGYYYIDISSDDKTLAFHGLVAPAKVSGIYLLDLTDESAKPQRLGCELDCGYKDRDFAFSPNGKHIAISRRIDRSNENIFLYDLINHSEKQLTFNEEDIVGLTWHPNGESLVYAAQRADIRNGFILDLETAEVKNISVEGFSYPEFSKNSAELFYQHRDEQYLISSISTQTEIASSPFPLIQSKYSHIYPSYSKATNKIVFVSNESGFYELWLSDPLGQNRTQLTFLKGSARYPSWSNDGTRVAFNSPNNDGVGDSIVILDVSSKKLSKISTPFTYHGRPTWSNNDNDIVTSVLNQGKQNLYSFSTTTSDYTQLTVEGGYFGLITDDNNLIYTKAEKGLWIKELAPNSKSKALIEGGVFSTLYGWTKTKTGIYFLKPAKQHLILNYFETSSAAITPILRIPKTSFSDLDTMSYIENKELLLFTQTYATQADIKKITLK